MTACYDDKSHLQQICELFVTPQQGGFHRLHPTGSLPVKLLDVLVPERLLANLRHNHNMQQSRALTT